MKQLLQSRPLVDLRILPRLISSRHSDRLDVIVSGVVSADQPIDYINLAVGDRVFASALYPRTDSTEQAFQLCLAQTGTDHETPTAIALTAALRDGSEHSTDFTIIGGPDAASPVRLLDGPTLDSAAYDRRSPPVLMFVDMANVDDAGVLHVHGWAVAKSQVVAVQVLHDEEHLGYAQLGLAREDVAAVHPTYRNPLLSGFALSLPMGNSGVPARIAVEAIDLAGAANRVVIPVGRGMPVGLGPAPGAAEAAPEQTALPIAASPPDPRRTINPHCDMAILREDGRLQVSGWVVCNIGVSRIRVMLDGDFIGDAEIGLPRPDVGEAYPTVAQAGYAGFQFRQPVAPPSPGSHLINLIIHNGLDDTLNLDLPVTPTEAEPEPGEAQAQASVPVAGAGFVFQLDNPLVIDGAVPDPVIGRLVIEGWTLARSGVERIDVLMDGTDLGQAYYGTARRDVEAAFPDWTDALRSGYVFHCPPRALESGPHTIELRVRDKNGAVHATAFRIEVQQSDDVEDYATIRRRMTRAEADLYQDMLDRLAYRQTIRLSVAVKKPEAVGLFSKTLRSLASQVYPHWELFVLADKAIAKAVDAVIRETGAADRTRIVPPTADAEALFGTDGVDDTVLAGVLLPGDELGVDALAEFAIAHGMHPADQFFYADEDRVSPVIDMREPFFKPDWSPDLLLSTNYIGRPWFATAALMRKAGVTPATLAAPQGDYDAVLRCTEQAAGIRHLAKLLCRRDEADRPDRDNERRVLKAAAVRRGIKAQLLPGCAPGTWRMKRTAKVTGKVSIIMPTCAARGHVAKCLETLRAKTAYRNFEIICIDNIPDDMPEWKALIREGADKVVEIPEAFNWSRFNNRAAEVADGDYLLFLNDDMEVEREDWLDALLEHIERPEVGIVGARLLYPDRQVQHAGIFLTTLGAGRHAFRFLAENDPGYYGLAMTIRNSIAITGACMLMRRDVFEEIGRFDEMHEVVNNDVDCCLRAWRAGYNVVYTPYAELIHHELASRAKLKDVFDAGHFAKQWRTLYAMGDPYFSPRLTKFADEFRPDTEPARLICAARPLFRMEEIQRILVMKLDHIGDLITAIPALRRLRRHFPHARIHLLASGAAKAFLAADGCVDEFIEYEFFHARSGLGQKGLTEDDLRALGDRLAPHGFDLAIDMRKQLETRDVLKFIPARLRAGFNYMGRFPWLDIALEWEGDHQLRRKQSHVSDDLLRLVDVIASAGDTERAVLPAALAELPALPASLPAKARALFRKPVVAVHPGVGAIMRQWMADYFATVIDLLVEKNGMNVVVVGGRDEVDLAKEVMGHVVNRKNVVSLAGATSLSELTAVLRHCVLYLGNNSGPKHIAAALGVPTVGVHSGIVDAAEWGPVGPRAIAVQKNMVCSPCYMVKPEDCVRDMACLKRLEPAVVHQYCEMMLAKMVPPTGAINAASEAMWGGARA